MQNWLTIGIAVVDCETECGRRSTCLLEGVDREKYCAGAGRKVQAQDIRAKILLIFDLLVER